MHLNNWTHNPSGSHQSVLTTCHVSSVPHLLSSKSRMMSQEVLRLVEMSCALSLALKVTDEFFPELTLCISNRASIHYLYRSEMTIIHKPLLCYLGKSTADIIAQVFPPSSLSQGSTLRYLEAEGCMHVSFSPLPILCSRCLMKFPYGCYGCCFGLRFIVPVGDTASRFGSSFSGSSRASLRFPEI